MTRYLVFVLAAGCALAQEVRQFRITVGLTDRTPKDWVGHVAVTGGTLVSVQGWRFSDSDRTGSAGSFQFRTKVGNFENQLRKDFPYGETDWNDPNIPRLIPQGLIVKVRGGDNTSVRFEAEAGPFAFRSGDVLYHRAWPALGGNARIERMPLEEKLSDAVMADDYPAVAVNTAGQRFAAWLAFDKEGDWVIVHDGRQAVRVTDIGDHHSPSIAVDPQGWIHVVYSVREGSAWQVYMTTRAGDRWTTSRRMSAGNGSHIWPRLIAAADGRMALVWQALVDGRSQIMVRRFDKRRWGAEEPVSGAVGNAWAPAAAFDSTGLWVAWDSYETGNYQVYARRMDESTRPVMRVSAGDAFAVRPSIAVSPSGTPAIAWEESQPLWGKDYAFLTDRRGAPLYRDRRIRVAYFDAGAWKSLAGNVNDSLPADISRYAQQPQLGFDTGGRLHLLFRSRSSAATARIDNWASQGRWEVFVTRRSASGWVPAVVLPSSVGRNGMRAAMAISGDRLHAVWPSDQRVWPGVRYGDLDVFATSLPLEGEAAALRDGEAIPALAAGVNPHPNENADVTRIRAYRVKINGKTYQIVRGDLHRHTELSPDGAGDGSLDDLYRYALDAAQMDYAHVADHQMGNDELYNWWITQKSNDLYFMPGRFIPLYGYERSVPYPNGHRNVMWAERGKPVLRIGPAENQGQANTGPILYPYLRDTKGIATSHTSATPQGTDWRDNDPAVEPIVEIYQGFESNYETAGAPRAWKEGDKPVHTGHRPAGYIWNAWAKGYKLGVQASSDHVSTHTSFACILVEDFSRQGLMAAMRARHTYAATDSIIMDYRINGSALMGDIVESTTAPKLAVRIVGTAPIKQVDVIKNNSYIYKLAGNAADLSFEYLDASAAAGESFYYVRAEQTDGQLVWSSPIWVRYRQ